MFDMAIDQQRSVLPLLSNRTDHPCGAPLARGAMALPAVARPAAPLRAAFSFLLLAFLLGLTFSASAGIKQCARLTPEQQMQADFCEARVACRVAIDLLATCADATAALRTFHDTLNAPNAGRPEWGQAGAQGSEARHALPTHARNVDGKLREERAQIEADERELAAAMHDAHCSKVELADLAQCEQLEKKALNLKRRLDQFERDSASVRAAVEPPAMLPLPQSSTPMPSDDQRAITFVDTERASAAVSKTDDAAAPMRPPLPVPSALAPRAVDTLFKEAISSADAEIKERAQREADKRVAAATAAAAAENTALANAQRTAQEQQEQADAQSMLSGSVGEVFALADRLEAEKQLNAARKAFRTVIARFPDHALAAAAVTRLSAASTTSAALSGNLVQSDAAHGNAQGGAQGSAAGPASPDSCDAQVAQFEAEVARLNERKPANASSIAMLQTVMYMASKSLALGQGVCSGNRREGELTNGIQATFDGARRACANISTSANECVARAPTW